MKKLINLEEEFTQDFIALSQDPQKVNLELDKVQAWELAASLQLALRHPMNTGHSAETIRQIAITLFDAIATTPALAAIAEMGWHQEFDS